MNKNIKTPKTPPPKSPLDSFYTEAFIKFYFS